MSRRTRDRYIPRKVREVEALISFILDRHAVGLLVLCGDEPWPTTADFAEMASCGGGGPDIRVQGGIKTPEAQRIVESAEHHERVVKSAGGKERIIEVFRDLRKANGNDWRVLRDSAMIRRGRPYITAGDYTARIIARRHHIHADTLRRNKMYLIHRLAFEICYPGLAYMREIAGAAM